LRRDNSRLQHRRMKTFLAQLDSLIAQRSILQHPFYQAWRRGELTRDDLARYARLYYPHVAAFPRYLETAAAKADDAATRRALADNLRDELENPAPHPELWLDFAEALGGERSEIAAQSAAAKVSATVATFDALCQRSLAAGLTALYCYESQQPMVAQEKMRGLRDSYGVTSEAGLRYFAVHATADLEHRETERAALGRCLEEGMAPAEIFCAAEEALDAYWNLLDAVAPAGPSC